LVRSADEDVRRPALLSDAPNRLDEVVTVLSEEMDAEHARNSAERRQLCCLLPGRLASRRPYPQRVDLGAETLRGTPRTPEDPLRLRLGLDQGQDPLGDRLLGQRLERVSMPSRSHVLCDLSQHELPQGREIVLPKEVLQSDLCSLLWIDLSGAKALLQLLGREVDQHDLVRLVQDPVRERLADADLRQFKDRVVQALEMLDVDRGDHVDPRVEDLVEVLVALLVPH